MTIFDKTAVEAAAEAIVDYDRPDDPLGQAVSALSAAEASMKSRGKLMEDGDWWAGKTPDYRGPVTIIRKETP